MIISKLLHQHGDGRQAYAPVYEEFFTDEFCGKVKTILEIGIQFGLGLRGWLQCFPEANVYGYEIQGVNLPRDIQDNPRMIVQFSSDSSVPESVNAFFERIGNVKMDVIIDDADHQEKSQLDTLRNFWSHLSVGGIYIIEDTGCRGMADSLVNQSHAITNGANVQPRCVSNVSGLIVIQHAS